MVAGLKPRGFTWVITDRLAVSERVGGSGFQHRRVRREEEITWLVEEAGINTVVSMLPGNQNLLAYREAGMATFSVPIGTELSSGARNIDNILTRTVLPELSAQILERMADGKIVGDVSLDVSGERFTYQIA